MVNVDNREPGRLGRKRLHFMANMQRSSQASKAVDTTQRLDYKLEKQPTQGSLLATDQRKRVPRKIRMSKHPIANPTRRDGPELDGPAPPCATPGQSWEKREQRDRC